MIEPMDLILAGVTVRDYVCSNCWGHLYQLPLKGSRLWLVLCNSCQDQTRGYVTRYYAESRRSESHFELYETRKMLEDVGVLDPPERKSERQILKELGFD